MKCWICLKSLWDNHQLTIKKGQIENNSKDLESLCTLSNLSNISRVWCVLLFSYTIGRGDSRHNKVDWKLWLFFW